MLMLISHMWSSSKLDDGPLGRPGANQEAMESPLVVWATFFLILEVIQFFFLHKASTKALSNRPRVAETWETWLLETSYAARKIIGRYV